MIDEQSVAHVQNTQCSDVFPQRFGPLAWCSCVALTPMTRLDGTQGRQVSHEARRGGHSTPASSHWTSTIADIALVFRKLVGLRFQVCIQGILMLFFLGPMGIMLGPWCCTWTWNIIQLRSILGQKTALRRTRESSGEEVAHRATFPRFLLRIQKSPQCFEEWSLGTVPRSWGVP